MKRTRAVALAVVLCALPGCSQDEAAPPPTIGDDSQAATEPSPTASEGAAPAERFDGRGHVAMPGDVRVSGREQQAAVDAWLAYWQVRLDAFAVPEVDPTALGEVARGDAASQVVSYVDYLQRNDLRTEGDLRFDVDRVRVRGSQARLQTCVTNQSVDVGADGRPAEPLTPFYEFEGHLTRVSDDWAVTRVIDIGSGPC
jgi:hypothetical protein